MYTRFKDIVTLTRFFLSVAVALTSLVGSAIAGSAIGGGSTTLRALCAFGGVLFLACAASAINQLLEKSIDAKMERTRNRPLPSGRISSGQAIITALLTGATGFLLLFFGTNPIAFGLGSFNLVWYNFIYTPLKTRTRFSLFIGAVTGALPPLIGFVAAGGSISDPKIISIILFMFVWQILHFLLLLLKYGDQYASAGFPVILNHLKRSKNRIVVTFTASVLSLSTILFPLCGLVSGFIRIALLIASACIFPFILHYCLSPDRYDYRLTVAIRSAYAFQAIVFGILIAQALSWPI